MKLVLFRQLNSYAQDSILESAKFQDTTETLNAPRVNLWLTFYG